MSYHIKTLEFLYLHLHGKTYSILSFWYYEFSLSYIIDKNNKILHTIFFFEKCLFEDGSDFENKILGKNFWNLNFFRKIFMQRCKKCLSYNLQVWKFYGKHFLSHPIYEIVRKSFFFNWKYLINFFPERRSTREHWLSVVNYSMFFYEQKISRTGL